MKRILVVLTLAALGLSVVPAAAAATPSSVRFDVSVALNGNLMASTTAGTFVASGAVASSGTEQGRGRFAGLGHLRTGDPNSLHAAMTLTDARGSISLDLVGLFGQLPAPVASGEGHWWITGGTGAYAGILGEGSWTGTADFRAAFAGSGPPTVNFVALGQVH
jgi:hypothetical protein